MEVRNQKSLIALLSEKGRFDVVKNSKGFYAAIFDDNSKVFISTKAGDMMSSGNRNPNDYQFAEIQCKDGTWLPTIFPISKSIAFTFDGKGEKDHADDPICMLNELIGLATVKQEIEQLRNFVKIQQLRAQKGLKNSNVSYHCVFTGNPGTGKTTVARIVASIYKQLGVLKKGHLIETDRAGLVGEYVGHTAVKTNKKIDEALDGVLFIDEAYSLVGEGTDFGKEAIATLLKRMEDDRERLVVILAGYTDEMKQFIATNPGLQSRFNRYIDFPDYSADELMQIFEFNLQKYEYTITPTASDAMKQYFEYAVIHKDKSFGNARFVRNIFEKTIELQANRLASISNLTKEELSVIELEDLPL